MTTDEIKYAIVNIGIEPKLTDNVVFGIGINYYQDIDESSNNALQTIIGIKIYI